MRGADGRARPRAPETVSVHPHVRGADGRPEGQAPSRAPVHPHVRGADDSLPRSPPTTTGSPPRAWGRPPLLQASGSPRSVHPHVRGADWRRERRDAVPVRFTPTCVGQTVSCVAWTAVRVGSPPRAWGRLARSCPSHPGTAVHPHVRGADGVVADVRRPRPRFTPTCVGQTERRERGRWRQGRFTPTCVGQTPWTIFHAAFVFGSPPRAWGRLRGGRTSTRKAAVHPHVRGADSQNREGVRVDDRFTPTCVGQTLKYIADTSGLSGSPPRAWGRPTPYPSGGPRRPVHPHVRGADGKRYGQPLPVCRFTPTCVGQTHGRQPTAPGRSGSPPRAWGRLHSAQIRCPFAGSPPRAWGRRPKARPRCFARAVHPHVRGADCSIWACLPRRKRFTPTCVGQTLFESLKRAMASGSPPRAWGRLYPDDSVTSLTRYSPSMSTT